MSDLVTVTLPDGSTKAVERGTSILDFVRASIGQGLAKASVFARLDGEELDLTRPLEHDGKLVLYTTKAPEALEVLRHDAAHVMASVVQKLFPGTQVTIGPAIEDGFYYDFHREQPFTPEDLEKIEAGMNEMIKADLPFVRSEVSMDEAVRLFEEKGEKFKVEIVHDIAAKGAKTLTLYKHGDWVDFCLGPHAPSTGKIGAVKLMSVSGAYWRGDPKNPQLQRIYGTAFPDRKQLDEYLKRLEEAKKRDHRRLGKELGLFTFHPVSPGAAFWLPKGTTLYHMLKGAMRRLLDREGYVEVFTPQLYNKALWEQSGHWGKYRENMFLVLNSETGEHDMSFKPMNCPSHHLIYGMEKRSYRELPLRLYSHDVLQRNEPTGTLGGLTRVRQFAQDDAHIYLAEDQIGDEVARITRIVDKVFTGFGLAYEAKFSTRPQNFLGTAETWDRAEQMLEKALQATGRSYKVNPGDGAFYGPKIDFDLTDALGRKWQCPTIQLDYLAPQRFDLSYVGSDNSEHRPVVIHRAVYGSFERLIAILVEHYAGVFPTWLAPVQARVLVVSDKQLAWAREVVTTLANEGFRVELEEDTAEKIGARVRLAELARIPYAVVIGDREVEAKAVAPRGHGGKDLKQMPLERFVELLRAESKVPWL